MTERSRMMGEAELQTLLARAAEDGARKALAAVGLHDENAAGDIRDVRILLEAFRSARRTVWQTFWRIVTTGFLAMLLAGAMVKLKLFGGAP
jgi:hypothetical protein